MLKSLSLACLLIGLAYHVIGSPVNNNLGEDGDGPKVLDTETEEQEVMPLSEGTKKYLEESCLI